MGICEMRIGIVKQSTRSSSDYATIDTKTSKTAKVAKAKE
ncbi:hypothetical protein AGMMS49921_00810 [Endomicrobiia bacterium]|nr:hypothetical protein AGMMS49921_00810 [Endomicrobiia bacterium]